MIYVECKPDRALVLVLTALPRRQIVHDLKGKPEVCRRIGGSNGSKALIDEDPGAVQPAYLSTLGTPDELSEHGLKVYRDRARGNHIVVLCPNLEGWVLRAARDVGIDLSRHGLPDGESALHRQVNARLDNFERLLQDLLDVGSPHILRLKQLLT